MATSDQPNRHIEEPKRLILVTIQLAVVLLAVYRFRIVEDFGFRTIVPLIFGGFIVNAVLPMKYRQMFFLFLSIAAITFILPLSFSAILIAIVLGMVGVCHLPIPFNARVALLGIAGIVLASLRNGWEVFPYGRELAALVIPIVGSIFMFRLVIYMYDLRHEKEPASVVERLSYFFMLPNICFLLFPVIDYRTFRRTYYDRDQYEIYQTGVLWILRGLTHLLLYRLIYGLYSPSPESVSSFGDVITFMLTTYLLYLRISGQFHLIVGILCLFGFNLPETHRLFYLANGFNDFWRRINIYWKDFMMKIVYYPVFVRVRGLGMLTGIIIATLAVFLGTWLLHSYQWFWLRGSFPISATDGIFWGVLAVFVVANSVLETTRHRKRSLSKPTWSLREATITSFKTVTMFSAMCVLWSLWNSATITQWLVVMSNLTTARVADVAILLACFSGLVLVGVIFQYLNAQRRRAMQPGTGHLIVSPAIYTFVMSAVLLALSFAGLTEKLPAQTAEFVEVIQKDQLNKYDRQLVERGYYEDLLDNPKFTSTLSIVRSRAERPKTKDWVRFRESEFAQFTGDVLEYGMKPSASGKFWGAPISSNSWGMRDKEYSLEKAPGVYRIALIGASMTMAAGVDAHEVFEAIAEDRLNQNDTNSNVTGFEILNFSIVSYGMPQKFIIADRKVEKFKPDMIVIPIYNSEEGRTLQHLANIVKLDTDIPYPGLRDIVEQSGATAEMTIAEIRFRLMPYVYDAIEWAMRELKALSEERGYRLVPIFFPNVEEILAGGVDEERHARLISAIEASGFDFLNLEHVYDGHEVADLQLAPWEAHLSVYGNEVAAAGLYELLSDQLAKANSDN